jgi:hypothetical protein
MEFVCCSNTRFGDSFFSNIIRFCLKWRWIHQLIIRMPNWFWFPKKRCRTLSEYDFHQRNGIQQPWNWSRIVHTRTHACDSKHTLDILFHRTIENRFLVQPIFIFLQSHTTQPRISCRWEVVNSYNNVPFYQSFALKERKPNFYLASNLNYLITKNDYSWWQNHIKLEINC